MRKSLTHILWVISFFLNLQASVAPDSLPIAELEIAEGNTPIRRLPQKPLAEDTDEDYTASKDVAFHTETEEETFGSSPPPLTAYVIERLNTAIAWRFPDEQVMSAILLLRKKGYLDETTQNSMVLASLVLAQTFLAEEDLLTDPMSEALKEAIHTLGVRYLIPAPFLNLLRSHLGRVEPPTLTKYTEIMLRAIADQKLIPSQQITRLYRVFGVEKILLTPLEDQGAVTFPQVQKFLEAINNDNDDNGLMAFIEAVDSVHLHSRPTSPMHPHADSQQQKPIPSFPPRNQKKTDPRDTKPIYPSPLRKGVSASSTHPVRPPFASEGM